MLITPERIAELCLGIARQKLLVIGDVMLDHYVHGEVRRISPEAPVPVVDFDHEHFLPGGAANVARNLAALGAKVEVFGVVGHDSHADCLRQAVRASGVGVVGLVAEKQRVTTVKTRIITAHQQMIRVDRENRRPLEPVTRRRLLRALAAGARRASAIIVADYAKGVMDQGMMDAVLAIGRKVGVPVCVDPKPVRPLRMKGCALMTPNRKETFELAGMADEPVGLKPATQAGMRRAVARIRQLYNPEILLVTLGEAGMLLLERGSVSQHLPTAAREVFDVSGAGDTVIAAFVVARAAGAKPVEAAALANLAAGVVVGKLGAATVTPAELVDWTRTQLEGTAAVQGGKS